MRAKSKTSQILEANGFKNCFPFVDSFRKNISETQSIHFQTCYHLKRKDVVEDEYCGSLYYKVTKINLPKSESKIFYKLENALEYIN
jgi:hypothetical protein